MPRCTEVLSYMPCCAVLCYALQWCAIERAPRQYSWTGYKQLFEMVRAVGLKLQVVLSFHACGGNVGDMAQVPLPPWVLQVGQMRQTVEYVHTADLSLDSQAEILQQRMQQCVPECCECVQ